jgi:iron complex outermembrane receptor protein
MKKLFTGLCLLVALSCTLHLSAQAKKDLSKMTKSEILQLSYEELVNFDLSELMQLADIVGVSTDELLQLAIVSASRQEESLMDAPLSASAVTGEMIKKAGVTSIPEALRLVPGVIVREQTPGNYDVHLRGFDAVDPNGLINWTTNVLTLVMINNRVVYNEYQGNIAWELLQVSIDDIARIEVVRGPAAALYGPNAVTGVINIITKNPKETSGFHARSYTQGGTPNTIIGGVSVGYNFDNPFSVRFSGQYDRRERHNTDYYLMGSQPVLDANGNYTLDENFNLIKERLGYVPKLEEYYVNIAGRPLVLPEDPAVDDDLSSYSNIKSRFPNEEVSLDKSSFTGQINYNKNDVDINIAGGYGIADAIKIFAPNNMTALSNDDSYNAFGQLFGTVRNVIFNIDYNQGDFETLGSGTALKGDYKIFAADAFYNWQVNENWNVKPGITYRKSTYSGRILGGDAGNSTASGYARSDLHIGKSRIIAALRADKFQYPSVTKLSPQLAYTIKPNERLLLRTSLGRAYRSPFMINLFTDLNMRYKGFPANSSINQLNMIRAELGEKPIETFYNVQYRGTETGYSDMQGNLVKPDYNLLHTDEIEVGMRYKLNNWLAVDAEFFYAIMKDLDVFSRVYLNPDPTVQLTPEQQQAFQNYYLTAESPTIEVTTTTSCNDYEVTPVQYGTTISFMGQPSSIFSYNVFVTLQKTKIKDYYVLNQQGFVDASAGTFDFDHEATPSFYGGFNFDAIPVEKLNLNLNGYFYGDQTLQLSSGTEDIAEKVDGNIILNFITSYEISEKITPFVNARNLLNINKKKRQFGLADQIGATLLLGVDINF